jgi:hypothetical protein
MSAHHQEKVGRAESLTPDNAAVLKFTAWIEALLRRPEESRDAVLRASSGADCGL